VDFTPIAAGDRIAFEQVFRMQYAPLCAFAMQYVRDKDRAEEVVQDLFVHLWQERERVAISTSLKSYLFAAVRNRCFSLLKVQGRVRALAHDEESLAEEEVRSEQELAERAARVQAAIRALPTERQRIFRMSRDEGLKYHEIAHRLGLSVKTVENQMGQALKNLRLELADLLPLMLLATLLCTYFCSCQ
jgi:RNA polymerase sigma-70 factor, ECF subfamily